MHPISTQRMRWWDKLKRRGKTTQVSLGSWRPDFSITWEDNQLAKSVDGRAAPGAVHRMHSAQLSSELAAIVHDWLGPADVTSTGYFINT